MRPSLQAAVTAMFSSRPTTAPVASDLCLTSPRSEVSDLRSEVVTAVFWEMGRVKRVLN